jgi:hypothetical protein
MKGSAALAINVRHDESPYEKPSALWKTGDATFRERLVQVVRDFLMESTEGRWSPESFHQLCFLIEACPLPRLEPALEDLIQERRLLRLEDGAQLHMLTLRTLLGLGWKGSPAFWRSQQPIIGERWPSILFEGLSQHGLPLAFDALPELARDPQAMREIQNLFPNLMRNLRVSINDLANEAARISHSLHSEPAALLQEWFTLRKVTFRSLPRTRWNPTLISAVNRDLGSESAPRFRTATMRQELPIAA